MGRDRAKDLARERCELQMTPMIDVTFLLLIFFMCTLEFKTLEGKLSANLPRNVGPNHAPLIEEVEVVLRVEAEGLKLFPGGQPYDDPSGRKRFVYDDSRRLEYTLGAQRTTDPQELGPWLKKAHRDRVAMRLDEVWAAIDARPGTMYSDVVEVLDAFTEAGFRDVTFVAATPQGCE